MKKSTLIAATLVLGTISFGAMAADSVSGNQTAAVEYVAVTGNNTLDGLTDQIAEMAKETNAKGYEVIGTTGDNYLTVNAKIYR